MGIIEVRDLTRVFYSHQGIIRRKKTKIVALDNISFDVKEGEIFGILGPNGAGKTTTIRILTTLLLPTSGNAKILGLDVVKEAAKIRNKIGYMFGGERGLYWRLSGIDNLKYFADLYSVPSNIQKKRIAELLKLVGLEDRSKDRVETYSSGMKQRLHIARALLHNPDLIFMDEPTAGLDPVGARQLRNFIKRLSKEEGKTTFLATHYMFEADELCDRAAVINHGKIIAMDRPRKIKDIAKVSFLTEVETYGVSREVIEKITRKQNLNLISIKTVEQAQVLLIESPSDAKFIPTLVAKLNEAGVSIGKIITRQPTLEDAYVKLVEGEE